MEQKEMIVNDLALVRAAYVDIAEFRVDTFNQLIKDELAVQQKLLTIVELDKTKPLEAINADLTHNQSAIKEAKQVLKELKEKRLFFTNKIDEVIVQKAMQFEKRCEPLIKEADTQELEFRKQIVSLNQASENKAREITQFKAHVVNEYFRIAAQFRAALSKMISDNYAQALTDKIPVKDIPEYVAKMKAMIEEVETPDFVKFNRTKDIDGKYRYISDEEAGEMFSGITGYDETSDRLAAIKLLDDTFSNYKKDFKNAEAAAKAIQEKELEKQAEIVEEIQVETSTNMLIASADTGSFSGPKIKKQMKVVVEESEAWGLAVIVAFVKNLNAAKGKVKVKTWGNLKVSQMADALGALATDDNSLSFTGLKLQEVIK